MIENHLEKLKCFHVTAEEGSLVKASQRLGLSQPAVTKSIRILEELLGTALFIRHRRGVELTKSGTLLQQFSQNLYVKVRDIEKQIQSSKELSGVIRIGTYETLGEHFWPRALRLINDKFPDLVVELTTQSSGEIWSKLESGNIDLVVDAEPRTSEHFFSKVLYADRFGVFCKKGSRFLKSKQDLPFSYVSRAYDKDQVSIDQHLRKMDISFQLLYDVESFIMTRSLIMEDVCVGVLPVSIAEKYLSRGSIQHFTVGKKPILFGEHRICFTTLEQSRHDSKIEVLSNLLKSIILK